MKNSDVRSNNDHFDVSCHEILDRNIYILKLDKISYKKNYVAESSKGGAYTATIHAQVNLISN